MYFQKKKYLAISWWDFYIFNFNHLNVSNRYSNLFLFRWIDNYKKNLHTSETWHSCDYSLSSCISLFFYYYFEVKNKKSFWTKVKKIKNLRDELGFLKFKRTTQRIFVKNISDSNWGWVKKKKKQNHRQPFLKAWENI